MRPAIRFALTALIVLISIRATCGKPRLPQTYPQQAIKFTDEVRFHNVSITWDGRHYFAINGGNEDYCDLNEYDGHGRLLRHHTMKLDGRAIFYHPQYRKLYVKTYSQDLRRVELAQERSELALDHVFADDNSSPGFAPDGQRIYELAEGTVHVYEFKSGKELKSFELADFYDEGAYARALAVSEHYLFAWTSEVKVGVYTLDGEYVTQIELPRSGYAVSLSYCNGMLWVAEDADGKTDHAEGYWYGYRL